MTTAIWIRSALLIAGIWLVSVVFLLIVYKAFDASCASAGKPCPGPWIEGAGLMLMSASASVTSLGAAHAVGRGYTPLQLGLWYVVLAVCALCVSAATWSWIPLGVGLLCGLLILRWLQTRRSPTLPVTR
jgi:hypothetical protein